MLGSGDPHEVWYRYNGKQIGYTGNNGTLDTDYLTSIDNRTRRPRRTPGAVPVRGVRSTLHADFDQALDPINSYGQGSAGGSYTVRGGDTLAGIAAQLWGDSSLWYKLAEANGMSAASALVEGQSLDHPGRGDEERPQRLDLQALRPGRGGRRHQPDDAPSRRPRRTTSAACSAQILLVAIAVAVTVVTAGAAVAALTPGMSLFTGISTFMAGGAGLGTMMAAGAVGGALGSAASQGLGVAMGLQDKFSWKGVALAGLAGGISAGLGKLFPGTLPLSAAEKTAGHTARSLGTLSLVGRGAFLGVSGSILTQGIGTMLGLQKKFDFANVAAAGLAGGVSAGVGKVLGAGPLSDLSARNISANLATSTANAIANATVRTLVNGTDFGDNMIAALPDIIGSTIGNMIGGAAAGKGLGPRSRPSFSDAELPRPEANVAEVLDRLPVVSLATLDRNGTDASDRSGSCNSAQ